MRPIRIAGAYILLALVAFSFWPSIGQAEDSKSLFAFVYHSSENRDKGAFGLYGKHHINQKVRLLHISKNTICTAITVRHETSSSEVAPFSITVLRTISPCDKPDQYKIGFFGSVLEYRSVALEAIDQQEIVDSLDKLIRAKSLNLSVYATTRGLVPYAAEVPLGVYVPQVYQFGFLDSVGYLVSYNKKDSYSHGPKFIVVNGRPQILTGWCSYPYAHSFGLNGELYFGSGSSCCNCGDNIMDLYKLEAGQLSLVLGDTSRAD